MLLRLLLRGDLGRLVVTLALLTLRKLELAALSNGVGNDLKNRWEYGNELTGRDSCWVPITDNWDGGIQGANRCTRPRMC